MWLKEIKEATYQLLKVPVSFCFLLFLLNQNFFFEELNIYKLFRTYVSLSLKIENLLLSRLKESKSTDTLKYSNNLWCLET